MSVHLSDLTTQPCHNDVIVTRVVDDSRQVNPGDIFVFDARICEGAKIFIKKAFSQGAAAVVSNIKMDGVVYVEAPGMVLARWAALQFSQQPACMVGVTGTNGKTSVAWFYQKLTELLGKISASIGTMGVFVQGKKVADTGYTSPTALKLHEVLHGLVQQKVTHGCLEVSSHGLALNRVDSVQFKAAGFTNLTHDHLDFHGTMDAYLLAKQRLFTELLPKGGTAVLTVLQPMSLPLATLCKGVGINVLMVGTTNAELVVKPIELRSDGMKVEVKYGQMSATCDVPLIGAFQAENLAVALGLCVASGFDFEALVKVLPHITSVPGRMERIKKQNKNQPTVVVDYAHTPDALEHALKALRPLTKGKLVCVFGCGGDRDAAKRPLMGKLSAMLADMSIVTDDNPRTENATVVRQDILQKTDNETEVANRAKAILYAINNTDKNDVILLAGKGHEQGQIVGKKVLPFDDREVARAILQGKKT